jgi:predicted nucleic acid-binding protein
MRIFLDANILFSAGKSDGAVRSLLQLLQADGHTLAADGFVVEEARRNLQIKATAPAVEALATLLTVMEVKATGTDEPPQADWLDWLPPEDRPVLAAAARLRCAALITGDRTHFGSGYGKAFEGVVVLSPAMAAGTLLV